MHTMSLACLGALEVVVAGHTAVHFPTDKVRALLVYLALEPHRAYSRQALTGLLWPDQPQATAFANLRQTLRRLRQSLDEAQAGLADEVLVATRQALKLRAKPLTVDVHSIDGLMALCGRHDHDDLTTCDLCLTRLAQVVALYRGDLLTDLSLPDAPPFEEWLVIRREVAQQQALTALHILIESYLRQAEYDQALAFAHDIGGPEREMPALNNMAGILTYLGDYAKAADMAFADEALALLAGHRPTTLYEPLRTYLTCYQVLATAADPRANALIEQAHAILMEQAGWIDEPAWRRSFLENVATHLQLQRAYATLHAAPETYV